MPGDFDLTPRVPEGRSLIEAYRPDGFTIAGRRHTGPILVLETGVRSWSGAALATLSVADFAAVLEAEPRPEILILGTGARFVMAPAALRAALRERGVALESMDTPAACRTFNVLLAEERRVAAALFAI